MWSAWAITLVCLATIVWARHGGQALAGFTAAEWAVRVGLGTGLVWLAFGLWYLRAPRIKPSIWSRFALGEAVRRSSREEVPALPIVAQTQFTRAEALSVWLLGSVPPRLARQAVNGLVAFVVGVALLRSIYLFVPGRSPAYLQLLGALAPIALSLLPYILVQAQARNARRVWLLVAGPRSAVFRIAERAALRQSVGLLLIASLVAVGVPIAAPAVSFARSFAVLGMVAAGGAACVWAGLGAASGARAAWGSPPC